MLLMLNIFHSIKKWFSCDLSILKPLKEVPNKFWDFSINDIIPLSMMFISSLLSWIISSIVYDWSAPICYWDGPNYIYAGLTLYMMFLCSLVDQIRTMLRSKIDSGFFVF